MKRVKYLQLLNSASKAYNALTLHDQELKDFSLKCKTTCATVSSKLCAMQESISPLSSDNISGTQLEMLHKLNVEIEQIRKEISKDLMKAASKTADSLASIKNTLEHKIAPDLVGEAENEVKLIKQLLDKSRPLLESCLQRVNLCLAELQSTQQKIDEIDKSIHRLDLPNDIKQTTRHLEKAAQDLSELNSHLSQLPHARQRFKTEFLPLRFALEKLSLQSAALLREREDSKDAEEQTKVARPGI